MVKNLFELKNASQVLVEDNIFENPMGSTARAAPATPRSPATCRVRSS
jgi:hypothetical protein